MQKKAALKSCPLEMYKQEVARTAFPSQKVENVLELIEQYRDPFFPRQIIFIDDLDRGKVHHFVAANRKQAYGYITAMDPFDFGRNTKSAKVVERVLSNILAKESLHDRHFSIAVPGQDDSKSKFAFLPQNPKSGKRVLLGEAAYDLETLVNGLLLLEKTLREIVSKFPQEDSTENIKLLDDALRLLNVNERFDFFNEGEEEERTLLGLVLTANEFDPKAADYLLSRGADVNADPNLSDILVRELGNDESFKERVQFLLDRGWKPRQQPRAPGGL